MLKKSDPHVCLPAHSVHTTHLLQPLDAGVFKSLQSFYFKDCKKYITDYPGRVITTDVIASLLAYYSHQYNVRIQEIWHVSA